MTIEFHEHKDGILLDLEEKEFTLLAYLIEKSSAKTKKNNIVKEPIDVKMNDVFRKFILQKLG